VRVPRRLGPGRPRGPLPDIQHPLTRQIRDLIDQAHLGNLREAALHTGLPYATLRDLYAGHTASPGLRTLQVIAQAYALPLEWFTGEETVPPRLEIAGELPPDPEYGRGRRGRRLRIPLAAWPLAHCFLQLERELSAQPPHRSRPIFGAVSDADECRQLLTAFLFGHLLEAQSEGLLLVLGAEPPFPGAAARPTAEQERDWVAVLRDLGRFWERTLSASLLR